MTKTFASLLAAAFLSSACTFGMSASSNGNSGGSSGGNGGGYSQGSNGQGGTNGGACYADTRVGCQDVSWSQVERLIDFAFSIDSTYYGYDKARAREIAKELYDNGVLAEPGLSVFKVRSTNGRTSRVVVSVRDTTGLAAKGLTASSFVVEASDGTSLPATSAKRIADATTDDVKLRFSTVVDDSGSISDCDAQFVADGVGSFFDLMPRVYDAELIKFATDVQTPQPFTRDGAALAKVARTSCTDRGATSLWDAAVAGLDSVNATVAEGELPGVVVFSDGFDNDSTRKFADVVSASKKKKVPVFVVGIGVVDPFALTSLARETGGGFVYVPSGARVVEAFRTAGELVADSYVVNLPTEGSDPRTIRVTLPGGQVLSTEIP